MSAPTAPTALPLPKNRELYFGEQFTQASVGGLAQDILSINRSDDLAEKVYAVYGQEYKRKPIKIYIDSFGGQAYQLFGLLGVIECSKTPIHTIAVGAAMSCGFLLLISGHKRFGYKYCTPLYHTVASWSMGKVQDMKEDLAETERLQALIEKITLKRTRITKARLKEAREKKQDWYMDAEEALELGVIDEIITPE